MYVTLQVYLAGAETILIKQAQSNAVKVFPIDIESGENPASLTIKKGAGRLFCEYQCSRDAFILPKDLPRLLGALPFCTTTDDTIVLSGKMPIWLVAAAAIAAQIKGWGKIEFFTPILKVPFTVYPDIKPQAVLPPLEQKGRIIGIIGDPNSGKSVFAELLEQAGDNSGEHLWRFDCDYAAPTPKWYFDMLKQGKEEEGKTLRLSYKRKWVPGAEEELVAYLENMQRYIPLVIADLPGGRHEKNLTQRIPAGRDTLLKAVDYFVIIAREKNDCDTGLAWQKELAEIGKASDIILTIYSEAPDKPSSLRFQDQKWRITGLDRAASPVPVEIKKQLWKLVQDAIVQKIQNCKTEI